MSLSAFCSHRRAAGNTSHTSFPPVMDLGKRNRGIPQGRGGGGCEKVNGGERFPAHSAQKEAQKAAQASDKMTRQMKIETDWDQSCAFVHTGKVIRVG